MSEDLNDDNHIIMNPIKHDYYKATSINYNSNRSNAIRNVVPVKSMLRSTGNNSNNNVDVMYTLAKTSIVNQKIPTVNSSTTAKMNVWYQSESTSKFFKTFLDIITLSFYNLFLLFIYLLVEVTWNFIKKLYFINIF